MSAGKASKHCQNRLDVKCLKFHEPYRHDTPQEPPPLTRRTFLRPHLSQSARPKQQHRIPKTTAGTSQVHPGKVALRLARSRYVSLRSPCPFTNILPLWANA